MNEIITLLAGVSLMLLGYAFAALHIGVSCNSMAVVVRNIVCFVVLLLAIVGMKHHADYLSENVSILIMLEILISLCGGMCVCDFILMKSIPPGVVTGQSIKETMDCLPTGLAFFERGGRVLFTNQQMEELCRDVTGKSMMDGEYFWKCVGGEGILRRGDRAWLMHRDEASLLTGPGYQLTATDVTERVELQENLKREIENLRKVNERMQKHYAHVDEIIREEETLNMKKEIHDNMGRLLITTKRFLEETNAEDSSELLNLWRYNIALMRREADFDPRYDLLHSVYDVAALANVRLVSEGQVPAEERRIRSVLDAAALECIANAVRHAEASELVLRVKEVGDTFVLEFTNDGKAPTEEVVPHGGLLSLKHYIEKECGTMEIITRPCFMLRITMPKEGRL